MKNKIPTYIAVILLSAVLSACHTIRPFTTKTAKKKAAIIRTIRLSQIKTRALKVNYFARTDFQGSKQAIAGIIDIPSDTSAKITATSGFGLPLARITISGDSAWVHSMLFEDFSGKTSSLLSAAQLNLTPAILKDLLLGNIILINDSLSLDKYSIDVQKDTTIILNYRIPAKSNPQLSDFNNTIIFSLNQGKIVKNTLWFGKNEALILIDYKNFTFINNKKIPTKINFTIVQGIDTTLNAQIKLKKIRLQ